MKIIGLLTIGQHPTLHRRWKLTFGAMYVDYFWRDTLELVNAVRITCGVYVENHRPLTLKAQHHP